MPAADVEAMLAAASVGRGARWSLASRERGSLFCEYLSCLLAWLAVASGSPTEEKHLLPDKRVHKIWFYRRRLTLVCVSRAVRHRHLWRVGSAGRQQWALSRGPLED